LAAHIEAEINDEGAKPRADRSTSKAGGWSDDDVDEDEEDGDLMSDDDKPATGAASGSGAKSSASAAGPAIAPKGNKKFSCSACMQGEKDLGLCMPACSCS
jgi:hypothetical protein